MREQMMPAGGFTMTPEELRRAGEALYGANWQTPLARDLGMPLRSLQRMAAGDRSVSPWIPGRLAPVMREHAAALDRLAADFERRGA